MTRYTSSPPDKWVQPRWTDQAARHHYHGPVLPMDEPSLFERIWKRIKP